MGTDIKSCCCGNEVSTYVEGWVWQLYVQSYSLCQVWSLGSKAPLLQRAVQHWAVFFEQCQLLSASPTGAARGCCRTQPSSLPSVLFLESEPGGGPHRTRDSETLRDTSILFGGLGLDSQRLLFLVSSLSPPHPCLLFGAAVSCLCPLSVECFGAFTVPFEVGIKPVPSSHDRMLFFSGKIALLRRLR